MVLQHALAVTIIHKFISVNNKSIAMTPSAKAETLLNRIGESTKLGDIRKMATGIKKDHDLAMELW